MLTDYSQQIFERQQIKMPGYIDQLRALAKTATPDTRAVLAGMIHDLNNDLAIVYMVLEIGKLQGADTVAYEVI